MHGKSKKKYIWHVAKEYTSEFGIRGSGNKELTKKLSKLHGEIEQHLSKHVISSGFAVTMNPQT